MVLVGAPGTGLVPHPSEKSSLPGQATHLPHGAWLCRDLHHLALHVVLSFTCRMGVGGS